MFVEHFNIKYDLTPISDKDKAENVILWIKRMRGTQAKKQAEYLGGAKTGMSVLGFGCHVLGIDLYPDMLVSKELTHKTGMYTDKGAFQKALTYNGKHYMCLHELGKNLSFGKVGTFMKRVKTLRALFKPEVSDIVIDKFYPHLKNKIKK
jgi:hypothetical protein